MLEINIYLSFPLALNIYLLELASLTALVSYLESNSLLPMLMYRHIKMDTKRMCGIDFIQLDGQLDIRKKQIV